MVTHSSSRFLESWRHCFSYGKPSLQLSSSVNYSSFSVSFKAAQQWRFLRSTQYTSIQGIQGKAYALRTILKEEGWRALYKGLVPSLFLVTHGAIQFTAYEELRKVIIDFKSDDSIRNHGPCDTVLDSFDYATLGASSKVAAILLTYPFQVIRARLQQCPRTDGSPRYMDSWHVVKETAKFEGPRGFYKGITANLLKNVPAASITFIVYENVLNMLKLARRDN